MKIKIHLSVVIIAFAILFFYINNPLTSKTSNQKPLIKQSKHLNNENKLQNYLTNKVKFENITFKIITIVKGDNFWKIAKKNRIKIYSLIGVNLHWKNLSARVNQKILVPSENGVIEFISSTSQIKNICAKYNTSEKKITIQQLPLFYSFTKFFKNDKKPIAIFIHNVKPRHENMTGSLAKMYKERELFRSPLGGRLSSFFGSRIHPIYKKRRFHNGLDIASRYGTLVGSSMKGVVVATGWMGSYGKAVIIQHADGYRTLYGHLQKILTRKGRTVKQGAIIGKVGSTGLSTGPHLHFTIWHHNKLINPLKVLW